MHLFSIVLSTDVKGDATSAVTFAVVLLGVYLVLAFLPGWIAISRKCWGVAIWAFLTLFLLPGIGVAAFFLLGTIKSDPLDSPGLSGALAGLGIAGLLLVYGWPVIWLVFLIVSIVAKPKSKALRLPPHRPIVQVVAQSPPPQVACRNCGSWSAWGVRFCGQCAAPIDYSQPQPPMAPPPQVRLPDRRR
jgi:hypothetical protein